MEKHLAELLRLSTEKLQLLLFAPGLQLSWAQSQQLLRVLSLWGHAEQWQSPGARPVLSPRRGLAVVTFVSSLELDGDRNRNRKEPPRLELPGSPGRDTLCLETWLFTSASEINAWSEGAGRSLVENSTILHHERRSPFLFYGYNFCMV